MNPRNVSASVVETGDGLKVWCASFSLKGEFPKFNSEKERNSFQKKLEKFLSQVDFSAMMLSHGIR